MSLKLITPPAVEPVALANAKAHMRIDTGDDDTLIEFLIVAARQEAEKITRRALITQEWELVLDEFPTEISLPLPVLQSVSSIKYLDVDGVEQTLLSTLYLADADSEPARIVPAYGCTWPVTRDQYAAVRIRYLAGYGDSESDIPQAIRQWIMIRVATLYENREAVGNSQVAIIPFVDGLLDEYRVLGW
jgi:uncharacterized phiE125 gp8 family phage protein